MPLLSTILDSYDGPTTSNFGRHLGSNQSQSNYLNCEQTAFTLNQGVLPTKFELHYNEEKNHICWKLRLFKIKGYSLSKSCLF